MVPWSSKLGYKARTRGGGRIWYVDGFAGPGKYKDGADGSPIIGARRALTILRENRGYTLGCINVEIKRNWYEALEEGTEAYKRDGVPIYNLRGDFSELIPDISRIIGEDDPSLLFVDPFGISPLKLKKLRPLLGRPGETDLVLTFNTRSLDRLRTERPYLITEAIGTDRWIKPDDELLSEVFGEKLWRESWKPSVDPLHYMKWADVILYLFRQNLKSEGKFLDVVDYPIRTKADAAPKYHLVFASRHYDAFELLNDEVCQEEDVLSQQTFSRLASGQLTFIHLIREQQRTANLIMAIQSFSARNNVTCRRDLIRYLVMNHWAQWHTKEMRAAVRGLIQIGKIERLPDGRGIDLDRFIFRW